MNRGIIKIIAGCALALAMATPGCSNRYQLAAAGGSGMEKYAEERYGQALLYMEASRYELAQQQFAIAEKTAVSEELHQLAHDGYNKAAGVIAAKR